MLMVKCATLIPSSTTFVKHFISRVNSYHGNDESIEGLGAGYFNTTAAITAIQFFTLIFHLLQF